MRLEPGLHVRRIYRWQWSRGVW